MSQLIVILLLIVAVVRAVNAVKGSRGKGAKPLQRPASTRQAEAGAEEATEETPRRARARKRGRTAQPETAFVTEGYVEDPRREAPPEPIACGNAQEHSHAHAAGAAVTAEELRRAVITSEILSKPVSLRDE